jgi:hypothetical protein
LKPDYSPFGPIPYGEGGGIGGAAAESPAVKPDRATVDPGVSGPKPEPKPRKAKRRNPLVRKITPNAIVRRVKLGQSAVSVCLDFFGEVGPECFSEGNVVYINRDHPLFKRESQKRETQTMHIARLLTQEIAIMTETKSPRLAFSRQSKLLKDAFADFAEKD